MLMFTVRIRLEGMELKLTEGWARSNLHFAVLL